MQLIAFVFHFRSLFFTHCLYFVEIIATFSLLYQVFTSTNSWVGVLLVSKGRPTFPHLSCYFCDICLGILGNALSLVCPVIRESYSNVFFFFSFRFPSPGHHYLTMFFSHWVSYSGVFLRPSFVCPVFEQWLRCCYLFLHGLPETHLEDRKRKAIRLTVHENTFTVPSSHSSFLELKFLITLFFFILLFVLCQFFLLYVASTTLNFP